MKLPRKKEMQPEGPTCMANCCLHWSSVINWEGQDTCDFVEGLLNDWIPASAVRSFGNDDPIARALQFCVFARWRWPKACWPASLKAELPNSLDPCLRLQSCIDHWQGPYPQKVRSCWALSQSQARVRHGVGPWDDVGKDPQHLWWRGQWSWSKQPRRSTLLPATSTSTSHGSATSSSARTALYLTGIGLTMI